jgi:hypothetical protein
MFGMIFHKISIGQFLPIARQATQWRKATRKMGWEIPREEFQGLDAWLQSPSSQQSLAFSGAVLCYGFGDDGSKGSNTVLSGERAWQYALRRRGIRTWHCEYIRFDQPGHIRLRPGAPARPKGFYLATVHLPRHPQPITVSQFRKRLPADRTGLGPEGLQMLCITNQHLANQMHERLLPFIALADYGVAPYGYNDYFDAVQMFCSNSTLGLGIGNIDRNYPLFGIADMTIGLKKI